MTYLLHNIRNEKPNSNYNTIEEVVNADGLLTFDGVYTNVYENHPLWKHKKAILFVTGDYIGGDNTFDVGQPYERFCDWNEIFAMIKDGAELGWHTWSHRDLTTLSDEELEKEVTPIIPMKYFAYPYGKFDERVLEAVKKAGYQEAFSVTEGDNSQFQRLRAYL